MREKAYTNPTDVRRSRVGLQSGRCKLHLPYNNIIKNCDFSSRQSLGRELTINEKGGRMRNGYANTYNDLEINRQILPRNHLKQTFSE